MTGAAETRAPVHRGGRASPVADRHGGPPRGHLHHTGHPPIPKRARPRIGSSRHALRRHPCPERLEPPTLPLSRADRRARRPRRPRPSSPKPPAERGARSARPTATTRDRAPSATHPRRPWLARCRTTSTIWTMHRCSSWAASSATVRPTRWRVPRSIRPVRTFCSPPEPWATAAS